MPMASYAEEISKWISSLETASTGRSSLEIEHTSFAVVRKSGPIVQLPEWTMFRAQREASSTLHPLRNLSSSFHPSHVP
jgi:hypothetical protein